MAIVSVNPVRESESCKVSENGRKYDRTYLVTTSTHTDNASVVRTGIAASPYLLKIGQAHGTDANAYINDINIREYGEDRKTWRVDVAWETLQFGQLQPNDNPLLRPTEYRWGSDTRTVPFFKDLTGKNVVNSAGESFEQLPEREKSDWSVTITRNEATPNLATLFSYSDAVNSDTFSVDGATFAAGYAKLTISDCTKIIENGYTYYRITYLLRFRAEGWLVRIADMGYNEIASGKRRPIIDEDGMEVRRPWPLNGLGVKVASPTGSPAELTFKACSELPFAGFGW